MLIRKYLFILFGLIYSVNIFGQSANYEKLFQVLPPSPNAASIGKFGGIEVGMATGAANFQIPLYELQSSTLKLPVSVRYYTTGYKVDEISSRVGTGWSLNAGGVITRTVFGNPDEQSEYLVAPPNLNTPFTFEKQQYLDFLVPSSVGYSPSDAQADLFNFNFGEYSGQFILDQNRNPILLKHSSLKIERYDQNGTGFKITTPDGVQYFFGGPNATESSLSFMSGAGCNGGSKYDNNFKATAWYLYQVVHPNNDVLTFSYEPLEFSYPVGRSESIYKRLPPVNIQFITSNCQPGGQLTIPEPPLDSYCINNITVRSVVLKTISSSLGNRMTFDYTNRTDCNDKLLSKISVFAPNAGNAFKSFDFAYFNTHSSGKPFLTNVIENGGSGNLVKKHSFAYDDMYSLPGPLSYGQDHWGYYNGKQNGTLIPKPKSFEFQQNLPSATANRDPDPNYCKKGLLSMITYPTGAKESISYEGNQVYKLNVIPPSPVYASATQSNTSFTISESSSAPIPITHNQNVTLYLSCQVYDSNSGIDPSGDTWVEIINQNTNTAIFTKNTQIGENSMHEIALVAGNTYIIKMHAGGQNLTGTGSFNYLPNQGVNQYMNVNSGGVRVSRVTTTDDNNNTKVKRYIYTKLSSPNQSSGVAKLEPIYEEMIQLYGSCRAASNRPPQSPPPCWGLTSIGCYFSGSSPWLEAYASGSSPTIYSNVVESFGEDFQNGGIEHEYTIALDQFGYIHLGQQIRRMPLTSYAYKNGLEIYQGYFKKVGGNYIPVKKIFTHYKEDPRVNQEFKNYIANKKYLLDCAATPYEQEVLTAAAYDCSSYSYFRKWVYADSVKTLNYDVNGLNYSEELQVSAYENVDFPLQTKLSRHLSDGTIEITNSKYSFDFTATPVYAQMVSRYMISPVIEETKWKGTNFLQSTRTAYKNWVNHVFTPESIVTRIGAFSPSTRIKYWDYDDKGNVLGISKKNGVKNCYLWGYGGKFPVAQVINVDYSTIKSILGETAITNFRDVVSPSDAQVEAFLQPLRNYVGQTHATSIESATYDVVTGITTQTDGKGQKTYYGYDDFQRLKHVKDQDGNIIKSYDYHYKP